MVDLKIFNEYTPRPKYSPEFKTKYKNGKAIGFRFFEVVFEALLTTLVYISMFNTTVIKQNVTL